MSASHLQYGVKHLIIAMTLIACVIVVFISCRGIYEIDGGIGSIGIAAWYISFLAACCLVALFSTRARMFTVIVIVLVSVGFSLSQAPRMRALRSLRSEVK